jgi:hypothetical protein
MQSNDLPILRLLAAERQADPARLSRLLPVARTLRPGYPEMEAFSNQEIFSPQKAIREIGRAQRRSRIPETRRSLHELRSFMEMLETKLLAEQDFNKAVREEPPATWPPPCASS